MSLQGLRTLWALYRRELRGFFVSPIAYIILMVFLLANGVTFLFYVRALHGQLEAIVMSQFTLIPFWFLCLLVPPLLTMRTVAEERRSGTLELLATAGVTDTAIVWAKYLSSWTFLCVLWAMTIPLFVVLNWGGAVDWGVLTAVYAGIALFGALLTSIGVFASTLSQNQLVAAAVSMVVSLLLFFMNSFRYLFQVGDYEIQYFNYISPTFHFTNDFVRGVFDYRYLIIYASTSLFFLFLAIKSLERRRWW
ncbi:MAG: ABC transporter permease [Planctomycetota bacterium]